MKGYESDVTRFIREFLAKHPRWSRTGTSPRHLVGPPQDFKENAALEPPRVFQEILRVLLRPTTTSSPAFSLGAETCGWRGPE